MIGSLLDHWQYTWPDIWSKLTNVRKAPPDLFTTLYRRAHDSYLRKPPEDQQEELIKDSQQAEILMNDPERAQRAFEETGALNFKGESAIVGFMESVFETVGDFEIKGYERLYRRLVRKFLERYNLRYQIDAPFQFRVVLPGVFAGFYADMASLNRTDTDLAEYMAAFEKSLGTYIRSRHPHDLKSCIGKASNYAEAVAAKTYGGNGSLGDLCKKLNCWPHITVRQALEKVYGFCSNYPGIRHGTIASPGAILRDLEPRDAILICLLFVSFSGYMMNGLSLEEMFML